jgi:SET domain-containing protein
MALSDRARARTSPIHGRGLFAVRRLRKDAYIGRFEGVETERDGMHVLWVTNDDGSEIGVEGRNPLRYLNHSSKPNAEFRGDALHALRNVQPGQEITIHYGEAWEDVQ